MKKQMFALAVAVLVLMNTTSAQAGSVIWGNSASFGNVNLEAFDSATGLLIPGQQFLVPNLTARADNGRGVAVLGHTIYYTTANSGNIYITNDSTHDDLGILVNTGFPGIANVATDGVFIYAASYQTSSGVVNKYDTSGNLVGSVNVGSGFGRDGFEVQNNPNLDGGATTFISNRGDLTSPYDVYKSDGTLLVSAFIDSSLNGFGTGQTGIAYDGNHYFVSDVYGNRLFEYSGTGVFLGIVDLSSNPSPPSGQRLLEDLSAVGNTVTNPVCGNNSKDAGEQCDGTDDAACPGQCLSPGNPNECTCSTSRCGDGTVDPSEQCDDGNTVDGDGCSATCQIETCYVCTGQPSTCSPNNGASCDDGAFCNGADTCSGGSCSVHAGDPCATGAECNNVCAEASNTCHVTAGTACTDDGNVCTDDQCDGAGACGHAANTASCDDGVFCNGADTCSGGACTVHAGDPCVAGTECNNACDESAGNCHVAANTACTSDGNPCSRDVCDGGGACAHPAGNAGATCRTAAAECDAAEVCDGTHTACPVDAAKPNGTACAGTNHNTCLNACQAGSCVPDFRTACCGNGVLEAGEQCEDGNQVAGDGCRADCKYELIPGDGYGVRSRDAHACLVEWSVVNPGNQPATDLHGRPHHIQRCKNNDPTCDFDSSATDDTCEFHVVACLNNVDPNLASCPQAGVTDPIRVISPSTRDAANRASLVNALQSLRDPVSGALLTVPLSEDEQNVCTAPFPIRVPLRHTNGGRQKNQARLITRSHSVANSPLRSFFDSDLISLVCEP